MWKRDQKDPEIQRQRMTTRKECFRQAWEGSGPFKLTMLVTACTRPALVLVWQNLSKERRGEAGIKPHP